MARQKTARPTSPAHTLITPANGIPQRRPPITFGSFLPLGFQTIPEENDTGSIEDELHLESPRVKGRDSAARCLQFSEAGTSTQPTPIANATTEGSTNRSEGKALTYIPPSVKNGILTATIEEEDIKQQVTLWDSALIGYVVGETPQETQMDNYVARNWSFVPKPRVLLHVEGYYIFRFNSVEDKELVSQSGPYYYNNKPVILRPWALNFDFDQDMLSVIPIWVRFPGLPVGYWSTEALSKVASVVGTGEAYTN